MRRFSCGRRAARSNAATSSEPSSRIGATTSRAPVRSHSSCQGTMFEWCSSAVISTSSPAARRWPKLAATRLIDSVVPRVKTISAIERRIDEPPDLLARALVGCRRTFAELVHAAVHVRVIQALLLRDRIEDGHRRLARRRVVEIGERLAVHELLQRGKVAAQRREIPLQPRNGAFCALPPFIAPSMVASRAVTCASASLRKSASAICSTTVVANAVVNKRRASAGGSPRARK